MINKNIIDEDSFNILIQRIKRLKNQKLNEADTRGCLIEPLLSLIGWDVINPNETMREYKVSNKGIIDYKLTNKKIIVYLEAKPLGTKLKKFGNQIRTYAYIDGIKFCIITDGEIYQVYQTFSENNSPIFELCLTNSNITIKKKIIDLKIMFGIENGFLHSEYVKIEKTFVDKFYDFCIEAKNFDPGVDIQLENSGTRHVRGENKPYITSSLKKNNLGFYIFTNLNKKDFDMFFGQKYQKLSMIGIANLLEGSLENKELIKCDRHSLFGKMVWGIKIDPIFLKNKNKNT